MKILFVWVVMIGFFTNAAAQLSRDSIHTDFVLSERRKNFEQNLQTQTIGKTLQQVLDSTTEPNFREACAAISQFLLRSEIIEKGFDKILVKYDSLSTQTRRALIEAIYASYPTEYTSAITQLLPIEKQPKLFAMQALYLYRFDSSEINKQQLLQKLATQFPDFAALPILAELQRYLLSHAKAVSQKTPNLNALFAHQKNTAQRTIYSFQRWNRDYPGIAVIQNADGYFQRDAKGDFLLVAQLARAGSNLPYFITNGNTPQGIFSIQGTEVSKNLFIGPTPNLQLLMPFEADSVFWHTPYDSTLDALTNYQNLLPNEWKNYAPLKESFYAGKIGRTEILAHGTTIDPDYFKDKPFYPLTPTLGCLCAKEFWNIFNGKLLDSEQYTLSSNFLSPNSNTGYLMVINLDNQQKAVTKNEVQQLLENFEQSLNKK